MHQLSLYEVFFPLRVFRRWSVLLLNQKVEEGKARVSSTPRRRDRGRRSIFCDRKLRVVRDDHTITNVYMGYDTGWTGVKEELSDAKRAREMDGEGEGRDWKVGTETREALACRRRRSGSILMVG